jgi:hypothetical protein
LVYQVPSLGPLIARHQSKQTLLLSVIKRDA